METAKREDITIAIASPDELFNAPSIDPFSDQDLSAMGEPGLMRAVRRMEALGVRRSRNLRLIITLPSKEMTARMSSEIPAAIRRYCTARIAANSLDMHRARIRHSFGLLLVTLIVLVAGFVAYLAYITVLVNASSMIQSLLVGALAIFVWVIVWDPLEGLIFDPVELALENRKMRRIRDAEIEVRPHPGDDQVQSIEQPYVP